MSRHWLFLHVTQIYSFILMTHIIHLFRMYVISILFKIPVYIHKCSKRLKSKMKYDRSMSKSCSFSRETIARILVHIFIILPKQALIFSSEFNRISVKNFSFYTCKHQTILSSEKLTIDFTVNPERQKDRTG